MSDLRDSFASAAEEREMQQANELMQRIEESKLSQNAAALLVIHEGVQHLKVSLANHMAMYIGEASADEARRITQSLCNFSAKESESVQVAYGTCIKEIAGSVASLWPDLHLESWPLVMSTASQAATIPAMESWSAALGAWSTHLTPANRTLIAGPWIEKNISSTNPIIRILACNLFIALANVDGFTVVDDLWEAVVKLKSDSTPDVALAFVNAMTTLRVVGGIAMARAVSIPCLLEHVCHTSDVVACAVLRELIACRVACVASQKASPKGFIPCAMDDLVPRVLLGYIQNGPPDVVEITLAEKMGELLHDGGMLQIDDSVTSIVMQYCGSAYQHHNVALRRWFAFNYPGILVAVLRDAPQSVALIVDLHYQLAVDPCDVVRLHIAAGFHEVVRLTAGKNPKAVDTFHALIGDPSAPVKDRIFANTPTVLQHLLGHRPSGSIEWKNMTRALLPHMAAYGAVASSDWRKLRKLFRLFDSVNSVVTAAEVHSTFIPLLLKQLSLGAACLKPDSAAFLARAFAATCVETNKSLLIGSLSKTVRLGASDNWQTRVGFTHAVAAFASRFSPKFVATFFQPNLVKLASDPIASVVQHVARTLAVLPVAVAEAVRAALPSDAKLLARSSRQSDGPSEGSVLVSMLDGQETPPSPALLASPRGPKASFINDDFMFSDIASIDKVMSNPNIMRKSPSVQPSPPQATPQQQNAASSTRLAASKEL